MLLWIALVGLPALAYASPADPSWISGFYDDADYDDVVALVTSGTGNVTPLLVADLRPVLPLAGPLPQWAETSPLNVPVAALRPRGPPLP
jgi:hypothetical protein